MLALIIKSLVVGGVVFIIGLFAQGGRTALAALMIHLPVFSLGALWVAASLSRNTVREVSGKALLSDIVWLAWMGSVFLMLKYSNLPSWSAIGLGLLIWALGAGLFLHLTR